MLEESGRSLTEVEKAYIAGFVDGEGYIGIVKASPTRFRLEVSIGQNDPAPLEFIDARYPGSFFLISRSGKTPIFTWRRASRRAAEFLKDIEPYLINKRDQAQMGIKFQSLVVDRGQNLGRAGREIQTKFYDNVRALNAVYRKRA